MAMVAKPQHSKQEVTTVAQMDYTLLRGRIRDRGLTQKEVAEKVGISEGQFCQKLSGNFVFRQDEIDRISDLLGITANEIGPFFFSPQKL